MDHRLAHRLEDGLGAIECLVGAADHEGQRSARCSRNPARDRRIDHVVARLFGSRDDLARGGDVDRRAIEQHRAVGRVADNVVLIDRFHDLPVGQHRDHRLDTLDRILGGGEGVAAAILGGFERVLGQVEGAHLVPRLDQVRGHTAAHVAEADECDFHVSLQSHE